MTSQTYQFRAVIEDAGDGGAFVTIPFDVEKAFGKKRVKIKATIDGEPYRGTLVRMGSPQHMLLVLKEIRRKIGKSCGDEVAIELEEDLEERRVEIPADLQDALMAEPAALDAFRKLSYTHQKECVRWVIDAKQAETRTRRIGKTVERLVKDQREP